MLIRSMTPPWFVRVLGGIRLVLTALCTLSVAMGITVATPGHFDALSSLGLPESTGPVIWWFDPSPGPVCWIVASAAYQWGEFIVDLDGMRNTGVTSVIRWEWDVQYYTSHMCMA